MARKWLAHRSALAGAGAWAEEDEALNQLHVVGVSGASALLLLLASAAHLDPELAAGLSAREVLDARGRLQLGALERLWASGALGVPALRYAAAPNGELRTRGWISERPEGSHSVLQITPAGRRALLGEAAPTTPLADPQLLRSVVLPPELAALAAALGEAGRNKSPRDALVVAITGPVGVGKTYLGRALAAAWGRELARLDAAALGGWAADPAALADWLERAQGDGCALFLDGCEMALGPRAPRVGSAALLLDLLESPPVPVILTALAADQLDEWVERRVHIRFALAAPAPAERAALWALYAPHAPEAARLRLARRFELTGAQIANAAKVARVLPGHEAEAALSQAASMQIAREPGLTPSLHVRLSDLLLPQDTKSQVEAIVAAARNRPQVLDGWGFGRKFSSGVGISALFHGEPGTGKTLAAEVIAAELSMPLYRVNVAQVLDKYVGETEKNLERVFRTARATGSVLLFDEADALFSSRVQVEHSQDRAANLEINLLLQLVERFDGIVILTTNLKQGIDKAFERRLGFKVDFPFPDTAARAEIWRHLFPSDAPLAADVDFEELAQRYELSGGSIKNAVLRAAYAAAAAGGVIDHDRIDAAAEEECSAAGKLVGPRRTHDPRDPFGF